MVKREEVSPDGTQRFQDISFDRAGDLVWSCQDLGPGPGSLVPGAREYEFWRTVRARDLPALAAALEVTVEDLPSVLDERFRSDVELDAFARGHAIPTEFSSWISSS